MPDAGNGVRTNGSEITGNDRPMPIPPSTETDQSGLVQALTTRFGWPAPVACATTSWTTSTAFWHSTHRDVHPTALV